MEFSINPQNSSLGIYIEELANLRIYNTEWILVTKIDLNFYRDEFFKIVELYENLERRCDLILIKYYSILNGYSAPYCKAPLQQIKNMIDDSKHMSADWFVKRGKRSILSVLGGVLLGGFGTSLLFSFQSDEYLSEFEVMRAQNKHRDMIISKQTSLLEYAFDEIEQMNETFSFQISTIESKLQNVDISLKNINKHLEHQVVLNNLFSNRIDFSMILEHFSLILTQYFDRQKQFLDIVSLTHKNPSNPNIIPPKVLFEELIKIKGAISSLELDLPFSISRETLSLFYQIATPRTHIEKDILLVEFSIPLVFYIRELACQSVFTKIYSVTLFLIMNTLLSTFFSRSMLQSRMTKFPIVFMSTVPISFVNKLFLFYQPTIPKLVKLICFAL